MRKRNNDQLASYRFTARKFGQFSHFRTGAHKHKVFVFYLSTFSAKPFLSQSRIIAQHTMAIVVWFFLPVKAFASRQETLVVSFSPFFLLVYSSRSLNGTWGPSLT